MSESIQVPYLKKEATVIIGTSQIEKLQQVLVRLCSGMSHGFLEKKIQDKEQLSDQEQSIIDLSLLIRGIYSQAEKGGNIYYRDLSNSLSSVLSSE